MEQKQRSNKEIMILILFAATVCLGVLNFSELVGFVKSFAGMLKPFVIGAAIAFVVNLPMKAIEEKWLSRLQEKHQGTKRSISIALSLLFFVAIIAFVIVLNTFVIPNNKYKDAIELYNQQDYLNAAEIFYDIWNYKDSNEYYKKCYQGYYKNDDLIVSNSKEMPYISITDGAIRKNGNMPSKLIIPDVFDGEYVTTIEKGAFASCSSIEYVYIAPSVKEIGWDAFQYCGNLKEIKLSNGLIKIGANAFLFTGINSIDIPQSVNSIGGSAFSGTELNSITVDSENTQYRSSGNCLINVANKTLVVGCKSSIIPADGSVNHLGQAAFNFCKGLTQITIPNDIQTIGYFCFSGSDDLSEISLPNTIQKIWHGSFYLCDKLTTINFAGTKKQWSEIEKDDDWDLLRSDFETGTRTKCKFVIHCTDGTISN